MRMFLERGCSYWPNLTVDQPAAAPGRGDRRTAPRRLQRAADRRKAPVTIRDRSLINHGCLIDATADITIGPRATLGLRCATSPPATTTAIPEREPGSGLPSRS